MQENKEIHGKRSFKGRLMTSSERTREVITYLMKCWAQNRDKETVVYELDKLVSNKRVCNLQ